MAKRVSYEFLENDKQMFKLLSETTDKSSNIQLRKIAKKAMADIVNEQLSTRQKQFIVLYYYEQNTMQEIADICGVNISTVSKTLRRARINILDRIKYYFY